MVRERERGREGAKKEEEKDPGKEQSPENVGCSRLGCGREVKVFKR
jgi:hypothetical protein